MDRRFNFGTILSLFLATNAWGEALTLEDVFDSVDHYYPLILGAKQDIEKSRGDYLSAQGGFDPVLKSTVQDSSLGYYTNTHYDLALEQPTPLWGTKLVTGYRKGVGNFPVYDSKYQTFDQGELRAGVEVPLLRGGWIDERRNRVRSGEIGIQAAEQNLSSKQLELRREAARKYWDWVAAGRKAQVAEELLNIALVRDQALLTRVQKGDAAKIDHTDNQRAVFQRQASLVSAKRSLQKAMLELSLYYRNHEGRPILAQEEKLPKSFPKLDLKQDLKMQEADLDQVASQYPDTQVYTLQLQQIEFDQSLAKNQILPKLDLNLSMVKDFGMSPGSAYLPPSNYPYELRVYLSFELPLFLRTARGKLDSISAQSQKLSLIQDLTRDRIKTQIMDSSQSLTAALTRIEYIQREVELAEKLEEAERKRFRLGDSSLLLINIREQSTRDAMNKEIDALADFFKAQAEYYTYTIGERKFSLNDKK